MRHLAAKMALALIATLATGNALAQVADANRQTAAQIIARVLQKNIERSAALGRYTSDRTYDVDYSGTGGTHHAELKVHAGEELQHALTLADQIDYLGGMPTATPKPVKLSDKAEEMLRFDLDNENETIRNYRLRVKQAEALGHYALSEELRKIISQEQDHQHSLATALGIDVPKVLTSGA